MTNKEAIEELVNLEFYARPFDNSVEASIETNNKIEAIRIAIKALQERPQGEWVADKWGVYHCNRCMRVKQQLFHNFCSFCGAEMNSKKENDNG